MVNNDLKRPTTIDCANGQSPILFFLFFNQNLLHKNVQLVNNNCFWGVQSKEEIFILVFQDNFIQEYFILVKTGLQNH